MRLVWPLLLGIACGDAAPGELPLVDDPLPWIDPTVGTGGVGFAYGASFVGAAVPHGLVKLGPDTDGPYGTVGFQHYSGYHADDDRVQGFSHLHLHGAGLVDYGVVSVMPTRAFDATRPSVRAHAQRFAKADERARPGAYEVRLADGTQVTLVATAHGAHHRYDFGGAAGTLLVDLGKTLESGQIDDAELHLDPDAGTGWGRLHHRGQMSGNYGGYTLWIALRARTPWTAHQVWADGAPAPVDSGAGVAVGAALTFAAGDPVELQVAVSLVDRAGAERNLAAELPAWDLEATRGAAEAAWRAVTGTIRVAGGDEAQRRTFYASLYHAFLMPTEISDVDGRYRLAGDDAPRPGLGHRLMSDMSLWDTYRTVHPLYALIAPGSAGDAARSLRTWTLAQGTPRWPIATGESGTMLGAPAEIVLADATLRGVLAPSELAEVWPHLRAAALDDVAPAAGRGSRGGVEPYLSRGWAPSDTTGRSVSFTTEHAHADFALGQLAAALGEDADATELDARRTGWRELFDARVGFLRGRTAAGEFAPLTGFDPTEAEDVYAEANAWQSLWMTGVHDPAGFVTLFGGADAAIAKLEAFFTQAADAHRPDDPTAGLSPPPFYWHGNEPDLNAAFLFAQLGRPDLTQRWVPWICDTLYADTPAGLPGNDDGGTLGSWYVWASLGLYPIAGSDGFVLGAPRFPTIEVDVGDRTLTIEATGAPALPFIAAVQLDGVPIEAPHLTHAALAAASRLTFTMSAEPTAWGRAVP